MKLALFDLDHTLIPFDSGMAWTRHLVAQGLLPADAERVYLAYCEQYVAGTLDIHAMHRACLLPLAGVARDTLACWLGGFEASMAPHIPAAMRALVHTHRAAGDRCVIVTATERFIAEPFARLFGINDLVATEAATAHGFFTGEIEGTPCFREHKVSRVDGWLAAQGLARAAFEQTWFYSDSISDLPLLRAVTTPVAVRPDAQLRAHALQAGWGVIDST